MKKILFISIALMLLAGCTDARVNVKNPKENMITVGDVSYTKGHLFSMMISQDPGSLVIEMAKRIILDEEYPIDDDVRAKAQEELEYVKEIFGDAFLRNIALYGFTTEEDYFERALLPGAQESLLVQRFIEENFDMITAKYTPRKVRIIEFNELPDATDALEAIKAGGNVEEVAKEYSTSLAYKGELRLVHSESGLPSDVDAFVKQSDVPTLTSTPIEQKSTGKFYVVQIVEVVATRFKDEIIDELSSLNSINQLMFVEFFKKGEFNVYDKNVFDSIKQNNKDYLPDR